MRCGTWIRVKTPSRHPEQESGAEIPEQESGAEIPEQESGAEIPEQESGAEIPEQARHCIFHLCPGMATARAEHFSEERK